MTERTRGWIRRANRSCQRYHAGSQSPSSPSFRHATSLITKKKLAQQGESVSGTLFSKSAIRRCSCHFLRWTVCRCDEKKTARDATTIDLCVLFFSLCLFPRALPFLFFSRRPPWCWLGRFVETDRVRPTHSPSPVCPTAQRRFGESPSRQAWRLNRSTRYYRRQRRFFKQDRKKSRTQGEEGGRERERARNRENVAIDWSIGGICAGCGADLDLMKHRLKEQ